MIEIVKPMDCGSMRPPADIVMFEAITVLDGIIIVVLVFDEPPPAPMFPTGGKGKMGGGFPPLGGLPMVGWFAAIVVVSWPRTMPDRTTRMQTLAKMRSCIGCMSRVAVDDRLERRILRGKWFTLQLSVFTSERDLLGGSE